MAGRTASGFVLRVFRVVLLIAIVLLIHSKHRSWKSEQAFQSGGSIEVGLETIRAFYPTAERITADNRVLGGNDTELGRIVQTSPASDDIIGYSGPTNALIAFGADGKVLGVRILSTGDTPEHLADVVADPQFLNSWNGLTWEALADPREIDGVTGATLTSLAIAEGILRRAGGDAPSFRFPKPPDLAEAQILFAEAESIAELRLGLFEIRDGSKTVIGHLARTSPMSDNLIGYGGPSDVLIALDASGNTIMKVAIRDSFDTESYVNNVRSDTYFMEIFNGKTLTELAESEPRDHDIEGVSGATMTSMSVADGIFETARLLATAPDRTGRVFFSAADVSTGLIIVAAIIIAFTRRLRASKRLRWVFQIVLVVWLGLINGHLLSQALFAGWAQNGIAWKFAPGLILLSIAALVIPLATKRQIYCHHICPHGALQQLVMPKKRRRSPPERLAVILRLIPWLLLAFVIVAAMLHLKVNLAGIEPFDAYVFRTAGIATIVIAIVGLVAARFIPMAYCKYGCPTGAVLDFLWAHGRPDKFSRRDIAAVALLALAVVLRWLSP